MTRKTVVATETCQKISEVEGESATQLVKETEDKKDVSRYKLSDICKT